MKPITYSFIIPHKNCPDLLQRCVNSIPRRDDVQIIVVDDNSDPNVVDWNTFQFENEKSIDLILTKNCGSAGAARNVGLRRAHGKWILFIDSDDFYREGFLDVLDQHKDRDLDVLYFSVEAIDNETFEPSIIYQDIRKVYAESYKHKTLSLEKIRYMNSPVLKMTSKKLIDTYHIQFEDVILGNDIWYSYQVGFFSKKIDVITDELYIYCIYQKSTTFHRTVAKDVVQIEAYVKQNAFAAFINRPEMHHNLPGWIKFHWLESNQKLKYTFALLANAWRIYKIRNKYVDGIKKEQARH